MSTATVQDHGVAHHEDGHEHHHDTFLTKYIFSQDHKMIAKQFLITGITMAFIAMSLSILFRIQLAYPDKSFPLLETLLGHFAPEGRISPDFYMSLVTIHGTIMVFFVLTAGLSGTFSNLLIPLQVGARDMASPFMNMLSYWFFFLACMIMLASFFVQKGPASGGWTVYPPLSALPKAMPGSDEGMTLWLISMVLFVASSLMGGINYVSTILNMRTKGMDLWKMPLTIWAFFLTAILGVLAFPVLVAGVVLLIFDRSFGTSFYLSDIVLNGQVMPFEGGSPILFQHLFWFLGHPEVYIVILPAMGLVSEIMATNSRKPIFGYRAMITSILAIAFLSTIVWGHHMFISGMNPFLGSVFTFTTLLIAIPSAVKAFNWITTLWKGNLQMNPAMLFSIGFVSTFITGGLTGIILGDSTLDINVHDTYFVVAHFHLVMGISALYGMFAGVYHWFPRMFGRMLNKNLGYIHFWVTAVCAYGVFFPMHFIGMAGLPRRYYTNTAFPLFDDLQNVNVLITVFALVGGAFQIVFIYNFFHSIFYGKRSVMNPWKSTTLEWTAPVEHIHGNWPGELPEVHRWPYDYSKPGFEEDFIPQTVPFREGEEELHH